MYTSLLQGILGSLRSIPLFTVAPNLKPRSHIRIKLAQALQPSHIPSGPISTGDDKCTPACCRVFWEVSALFPFSL